MKHARVRPVIPKVAKADVVIDEADIFRRAINAAVFGSSISGKIPFKTAKSDVSILCLFLSASRGSLSLLIKGIY